MANRKSINLMQFSPPAVKKEDEPEIVITGEMSPITNVTCSELNVGFFQVDSISEDSRWVDVSVVSPFEEEGLFGEQSSIAAGQSTPTVGQSQQLEGENVISDLFMCLACNLTFQDVLGIFFGQSEPLNNIRPQIRQFITARILNNQGATDENISAGVEQILAAQREVLASSLSEVNVREDIDFVATLDKFLEKRLHDLIELIVRTPEGVNFGTEMYNLCIVILSELVVLCVQCFTDGKVSLLRIIQSRLYQILNSSPIVNAMSVPPSSQVMEAYIVRRLAVAASVQPPLQPVAVVQPEDYFDNKKVIEESDKDT